MQSLPLRWDKIYMDNIDLKKALDIILKVEKILLKERSQGKNRLKSNISKIDSDAPFFDYPVIFLPKKGTACFIGDTHGDYISVQKILKQIDFYRKVKGKRSYYLVFLGDYEDRGAEDIKNLLQLISLKTKYPDNIFLLRGNHEEMEMGQYYGFLQSCINAFDYEKGLEMFQCFNEFFDKLPCLVVAKNGIAAVHGGIPKEGINSLRDLNDQEILREIRWNDPTVEVDDFISNYQRGGLYMYGIKAFDDFMKQIGAKVMIRGHQYNSKGYRLEFHDRLLTIFSTGKGSPFSAYQWFVLSPRFVEVSLEKPISKWKEEDIKTIKYDS